MAALMTIGLVLASIVSVSVAVAWAESRARRRATTPREPGLTHALLAGRDDDE